MTQKKYQTFFNKIDRKNQDLNEIYNAIYNIY